MPILPQVPRPSFSIVVNSGPVSTALKDFQRARNRDIQLPIYGPFDSPTVRYRDVMLAPTSWPLFFYHSAADCGSPPRFGVSDLQMRLYSELLIQ